MTRLTNHLLAAGAFAISGLVTAPAVFAQSTATYSPGVGTATNCNVGTQGATVASKDCTSNGITVTMTAWGYTAATLNGTAKTGFTQGTIGDWNASGIGAYTGSNESGTASQHAFDNMTTGCVSGSPNATNCGGSIEALLLNFNGQSVNLSSYGIGFNGGDADLMVWAWTGGSFNGMAGQVAAGSAGSLTTQAASMAGWTLVSTKDYGTGTGDTGVSNSIYSSYFMITTYFGANSGGLTIGNDSFKIDAFTVSSCSGSVGGTACTPNRGAPEPGSLALAGVALMGVFAMRRRYVRLRK